MVWILVEFTANDGKKKVRFNVDLWPAFEFDESIRCVFLVF